MRRSEAIAIRKNITDRKTKERAIREKLAPFLEGKERIAAYWPVNGEADVFEEGFYLPKTMDDRSLRFGREDTTPGYMNIPEPKNAPFSVSDMDVILVPLVQFMGTHRQGYGQGCYDRTLKDADCLKIGIAFDEQEGEFDVHSWDVPLDMVITPGKIVTNAYNEGDMELIK